MPHQNRVTPFGNIVAHTSRGAFMGNRGVSHNDKKEVIKPWANQHWITCLLQFKNRPARQILTPGRYTELFFLDEATALAAGHCPCAECRRADYNAFKAAWEVGNAPKLWSGADQVDRVLHKERAVNIRTKAKAIYEENIDGVFVTLDGETAHIVWGDDIWLWSMEGYSNRATRPQKRVVTVLTPSSITKTLAAGYRPQASL